MPERFPLPVMTDLLMNIGEKNVFSTIDLVHGYWQVPLDKNSRDITAFSTPTGHYAMKRMSAGLRTSSFTFMRLMTALFKDLLGKSVLIYLDIIITSKDTETQLQDLDVALKRLRKANLN